MNIKIIVMLCLVFSTFKNSYAEDFIEGSLKDETGSISDYSQFVLSLEEGPSLPKVKNKTAKTFTINQINKKFSPSVVVLETDDSINFKNLDDLFHNVFSSELGNKFDLGVYKGSSKYSEDKKSILEGDFQTTVPFKKQGKVHIYCNIHQDMVATAYVFSHSYFARADRDGLFKISAPPKKGIYHLILDGDQIEKTISMKFEIPLKNRILFTFKAHEGAHKVEHKKKNGEDYKDKKEGSNTDDFY